MQMDDRAAAFLGGEGFNGSAAARGDFHLRGY